MHLILNRPVAALHGDRLVLRDEAGRVAAGGHVIDPFPPERRQTSAARTARLRAQSEADPARALAALLAAEGAVDLRRFALARNLAQAPAAARVIGDVALSEETHAALRIRLLATLAGWHAAQPDMVGPNKPVLLARAGADAAIAAAVLGELLAERLLVQEGAALRLPGHRPVLGEADEALWPALRALLEAPLRPPRIRELAAALEMELEALEAALVRLERFGRLQRVAPNRVFLPETIERLIDAARALAAEPPEHAFTAAEFNARTGIGRNLVIQVLEYLDRAGITRREGNLRCLV